MKKVILDTNAISHFMRGDESVWNVLAEAEIVYVSVVVLAELYTGFKGGSKEQKNLDWVKSFLSKPTVSILDVSEETAEVFAHIKYNLKKSGEPIPINDV